MNQKEELDLEFDRLKLELEEKDTSIDRQMAGIHRDIRQYFKHSVTRIEKEEVPKTRTKQSDKTSEQNKSNEQPDI